MVTPSLQRVRNWLAAWFTSSMSSSPCSTLAFRNTERRVIPSQGPASKKRRPTSGNFPEMEMTVRRRAMLLGRRMAVTKERPISVSAASMSASSGFTTNMRSAVSPHSLETSSANRSSLFSK